MERSSRIHHQQGCNDLMVRKLRLSILVLLLLGGCTLKFTYNYLDWITASYLDDFVELDNAQQAKLDKAIEDTLFWHRTEQLPLYSNWLQTVKQDVNEGLTLAEVEQHNDHVMVFWAALMEHFAVDMAMLLPSLSHEQQEELFANFADKNDEFQEEYVDVSLEEKREQFAERLEDTFDHWLDSITKQQLLVIKAAANQMEHTSKGMLATRQRWQNTFTGIIKNHKGQAETNEAMRTLFVESNRLRSKAYQQQMDHNQRIVLELIVAIAATLTEEQKKYFFSRVDKYKLAFSELSTGI